MPDHNLLSGGFMKRTLPLAAMERLLKRVGAHRVSEDAKAALRDVLEEYAEKIG